MVDGNVNDLDMSVVFAMFLYPPNSGLGVDGTNELDVEFARWGQPRLNNLDYTMFTATQNNEIQKPLTTNVNFQNLKSTLSCHKIIWTPDSIKMFSYVISPTGEKTLASNYQMPASTSQIPKIPLRVHMNLWLFKGKAPTNGKDVSVGFRDFKYTPLQQTL